MLGLTDANVSEDKVWGVLDCLIRFLRCRLRDEFVQPIYLNDCLWEKEPANEEWLGTKHGMIFVYKKSQSLNHRSKRKKGIGPAMSFMLGVDSIPSISKKKKCQAQIFP